MLKSKKLLIALMLLIAVLLIPSMVNASNEEPTVSSEVYGVNKSIKVTLSEINLSDDANEYKFGVSKVKATEPTEWLDLQDIEATKCTAIITPENEIHRSIMRSTDKCYIFVKDITNDAIVIKTQVDLSLPLESALNITLEDNRSYEISYLYKDSGNVGNYYVAAVKIDNRDIIQEYLDAKDNNENTLNAVKNMLPTDSLSNNSWKEMTAPNTFDHAYYYNGDLTKYEGLYMIWGQISYSEGRNIYGYVLYDNYPNGYVLPEEGKGPAPKIERVRAEGDITNLVTDPKVEYHPVAGNEIKIDIAFDQAIVKNESPVLTIKFGTGNNIELKECEVSSKILTYSYKIKNEDLGTLQIVSLVGGNVTNNEGTAANLTLPEISGAPVVAIEGDGSQQQGNTTKYISFPYLLYFGTTTIDLKPGVYDGEYTMYYQFVEVNDENEATKYDDTRWIKIDDRKPERPSAEFTGEKKFALWIKLEMKDKTVYESHIYKFNGSTPATNEPDEQDKITTTDKDTTTAKDNLPDTGRVVLYWIIGIVAVLGITAHIRYKKLYM